MLGSLNYSFLGGKSTEKERKQKPELKNNKVINTKVDSDDKHLNELYELNEIKRLELERQNQEAKDIKIIIYIKKKEEGKMFDFKIQGLSKEFKEKSEYLSEKSKIESYHHEEEIIRILKETELEMARLNNRHKLEIVIFNDINKLEMERFLKEIELKMERDKQIHEMEMEKIENEGIKMMQNLDNILKWNYDNYKFGIDYDNGNVRDIKLKIKDLVKKREMNEKEMGSKKGKIGHFEKKTKLDIRKYKSQLKYKYKNDGIEFLRKYRKIEKEIELRDQRCENEKLNLQKEIKGNESNGDKENKELDIKIVPKEEQLNTQNLQDVLKNIIKNFLQQLKDKHSGDLFKIDHDTNNAMNQGKNKIKMIDKINFNKDESLHNTDAGTSGIARHDSKIPFPFQVNQSNSDNRSNAIMQINNTFIYNNQTSKMDQNINNESKFINISMNMKVNQKINDLYKYNPKYIMIMIR